MLFPSWSDTVLRLALLVLGLGGLVGVPLLLMAWVRTPYVNERLDPIEQPIPFDHRHHVEDDGIECYYCHYPAQVSAYAGVPPASLCMNCHSQIWNEAPLLEPVRRSFYENVPIQWRRVHRLPDFVFFNHAAHVNRGVGCVSCHGRVETMARVYQVAPLTMGWCLDCHRDPVPHLRPLDAITDSNWDPERDHLQVGRGIRDALDIQPPTNCTGCHR